MLLQLTYSRTQPGDLAPKDMVDEDFEIVETVGRGAFSTVYRAVQKSEENRYVALKLLHSGIQQSLERKEGIQPNPYVTEEALLARLSHPAICKVHRLGITDSGRWYSAMEWVEGETLGAVVRRHRTGLPLIAVADIIAQLGSVLSEMHKLQVVHRDLKPANLMLEGTSSRREALTVRLLDFGLARLAGEDDSIGGTETLLVGTPAYMSPEQARGGPIDPRSDIYSLATVAYELLTGKRPIQLDKHHIHGDDYVSYLKSDTPLPTTQATKIRPELPEDVDDILNTGLARERHMRPATVERFCDDLEVVLRAHAPATPRPNLLGRALKRLKRR